MISTVTWNDRYSNEEKIQAKCITINVNLFALNCNEEEK